MPSHSPQRVRPRLAWILLASLSMVFTGSCVAHRHAIGLGSTGTGEQWARQYYILFGLIAANDVDAQRMAGGLTSYEILTEYAFLDLLLAPFLLPLTMTTRTVTVRT